ncbi:cyclase family protein [Demequina aestuarii]|uniref:cyclase family protein n=1 Tax=Demequina aestuarii TaxID=327095 RepID=UPI00078064BF|nr:cyclase family protein [Demequina aestuarii]
MPTRLVDLSHPIADGAVTTPGHPAARIGWWRDHAATRSLYEDGTSFAFSHLDIIGGTGTYMDAPLHRFPGEGDVLSIDLARVTNVPGIVVDGSGAIGPDAFEGLDLAGRAVLVRTGWSARFGQADYAGGHPHLTADAGALLAASGCAVVGIDSPNVDGTATGARPVHTALLEAGIPIVEHLTRLDALPQDGFSFTALPLPFVGLATSPVRAVAAVPA